MKCKKKTLLIVFFSIGLTSECYLQNFDYGVVFETNFSSHTNNDPTKPADGQFQWNNLTTFGVGLYASNQIVDHLNLSTALVFRQRGYKEDAQTGVIFTPDPIPFSYPSLQNRFNYVSVDAKLKYLKNNSNKLKVSPIIGLSANFLVSKNLESERMVPINEFYPVNQYQDNWNKLNLNYIIGFSLYQLNRYSLDFEFNRSLTPLLKVETLVVKDWTWSLKLNISVQKLFNSNSK